ncbi:hypothetical protein CMO94_01770 [Candidatus Woesearchaeota archaeon]|nr:hypothetical protein [Candidatus Woesearchaeota archaeon]
MKRNHFSLFLLSLLIFFLGLSLGGCAKAQMWKKNITDKMKLAKEKFVIDISTAKPWIEIDGASIDYHKIQADIWDKRFQGGLEMLKESLDQYGKKIKIEQLSINTKEFWEKLEEKESVYLNEIFEQERPSYIFFLKIICEEQNCKEAGLTLYGYYWEINLIEFVDLSPINLININNDKYPLIIKGMLQRLMDQFDSYMAKIGSEEHFKLKGKF